LLISTLLVVQWAKLASSECANACSGHGKCTSFDMCVCLRNWQANDCSEQICQFGLAHVDTPKGDLDMDGEINKPDVVLAQNNPTYPYGTTEQFPSMSDSGWNVLENTAHYYMECSNKGKCDRTTGECQCFDGYDGVACQRASCPGSPVCSGHGVCKSAKQIAMADNGNVYKLWDKDATMGCECDGGYYGPDCSLRNCKYGIDPMYLDDTATIKFSTFDFAVLGTTGSDIASLTANSFSDGLSVFSDGLPQAKTGFWAIRFFDHHGEDWLTEKIPAGASCDYVIRVLEGLPNNVIPAGSLYCSRVDNVAGSVSADGGFNTFDSRHPGENDWDDEERGTRPISNHPYFINYHLSIWEAQIDSLHSELSPQLGKIAGDADGLSTSGVTAGPQLFGYIYRIQFYGNPGKLREPEIEVFLDGNRPTLDAGVINDATAPDTTEAVTRPDNKVITKVWTDGQQGEDNDYFADHCDGVTVKIFHKQYDDALMGDHVANPGSINLPEDSVPPLETSLNGVSYFSYLSGFTPASKQLLKACLGDSDFDVSNNIEISNWDYGTQYYPHIIKLVPSITTYTDGGYYAAIWYDTTVQWDNIFTANDGATPTAVFTYKDDDATANYNHVQVITGQSTRGTFRLLNTFLPPDVVLEAGTASEFDEKTSYEVYTTKGTLALTSNASKALFSFASKNIFTVNATADVWDLDGYDGDISCEYGDNNGDKKKHIFHCLNKTDIFTLLNWEFPYLNPRNINLYTATRLSTMESQWSVSDLYDGTSVPADHQVTTAGSVNNNLNAGVNAKYMTHVINSDISTNWGAGNTHDDSTFATAGYPETTPAFRVYKFFPAVPSTYSVVNECSNRGVCDSTSGVCNCFSGYTSDSCSEQSSVQV